MTVTMHLKKPDGTWPFILTHNVAAIVPSKIYPADKKQPDDKVIGSGPYQLEKYVPNEQAVFKANPNYSGANKPQTPNVIVQYYEQPSALKLAIEQGDVDVAYRSLSPTDLEALKGESDKGIKVIDGAGTEIRYIVFNVTKTPADNIAVRKAIAQIIDRQAIATNVYKDTVKPLYSTVPAALPGAKESFKDAFGDPDVDKAKRSSPTPASRRRSASTAGTRRPTTARSRSISGTRSSASSRRAACSRSSSTRRSGRSTRTPRSPSTSTTSTGWAGSRTTRTATTTSRRSCATAASSRTATRTRTSTPRSTRSWSRPTRRSAPTRSAWSRTPRPQDVPLIPLWEGKQIAAIRDGVEGVEKTFDPAFQFRFWLVTKKAG